MNRCRAGITLVEVALGTILVGVGIAAIASAAGHTATNAARSRQAAIATALISDIVDELSALPAFDGDDRTLGTLPPGAGQSARSCVADYAAYSESPITWGSGVDLVTGPAGWSRSVAVSHAQLAPVTGQPSATESETNILLVTVSASLAGRQIAQVVLVRSAAGDAWHTTMQTVSGGGT